MKGQCKWNVFDSRLLKATVALYWWFITFFFGTMSLVFSSSLQIQLCMRQVTWFLSTELTHSSSPVSVCFHGSPTRRSKMFILLFSDGFLSKRNVNESSHIVPISTSPWTPGKLPATVSHPKKTKKTSCIKSPAKRFRKWSSENLWVTSSD